MPRYPWLQSTFSRISEDASANRLSHALLINGSRGIGVSELASEIASFRLCSNGSDAGACKNCKACELVSSGSHPDLTVLEPEGAAQIIKVDQVRALVEFMSKTPQIGEWKVALLSPAHRLNHNAANALLKVLEEPAGKSLLILATERSQMLLPTVRSRCAHIKLPDPDQAQTETYLIESGIDATVVKESVAQLGNKPLLIADWINTGQIESWNMVLSQIGSLERGDSSVVQAAAAMKDLDTGLLLNWLLDDVAEKMRSTVSAVPTSFRAYEALYNSLLDAKRTLDSGANPNPVLTLETIFLDWPRS